MPLMTKLLSEFPQQLRRRAHSGHDARNVVIVWGDELCALTSCPLGDSAEPASTHNLGVCWPAGCGTSGASGRVANRASAWRRSGR